MEALILVTLVQTNADVRDNAILPPTVAIEPFLRHRAEIAFVIVRFLGVWIPLQDAQLGEQFAHGGRLACRQWEIVRGPTGRR